MQTSLPRCQVNGQVVDMMTRFEGLSSQPKHIISLDCYPLNPVYPHDFLDAL